MARRRWARGRTRWLLPVLGVLVLVTACGGEGSSPATSGSGSPTTTGGDRATTTTPAGDGGGTVPLEGSSSCSDPAGDTD